MSPGERRRLLGLLGFLTFNAVYVGVVMAPVLTQIASEFSITTGTAGLVVAAYGAPGIVVAVLTGHLLKDTDYVINYHNQTLVTDWGAEGDHRIVGHFSNQQVRVEASLSAIRNILEGLQEA